MEAKHLLPSEALTQFLPLATEVDTVELAVSEHETVFGFRVGNLGLLVASQTYCEVIEQLQVNPLPNVESWFSGLLNLRGNLVPVIDLQLLLEETAHTEHEKRQLFAIGQGDRAMAFWIDGLPEILAIPEQALKQLPPIPNILQHCVTSAYFQDGQIWLQVQFDELFRALGRHYAMEEIVT